MKNLLLLVAATFLAVSVWGQALTGTRAIPSANYPSIKVAVDSLNLKGVGTGGVTFNVAAGHTETNANITLTTATASATNPIVFIKSGGGANPLITAGVGTSASVDGIIKIQGTDYVTFDGIDVKDPVSNSTATTRMEWGYAILMTSATDASQHITLVRCNITLQKIYTASPYSTGIYSKNHTAASTTTITPTSAAGVVSYCSVDGCTISDAIMGINWIGYASTTYYGTDNYFGVNSGNTITNIGTSTVTSYGIYTQYLQNNKIYNNIINVGDALLTTGSMYGIYTGSTGATNTSCDFSNNQITLVSGGANTAYGIYNTSGATGTNNQVTIAGNQVIVSVPKFTSGTVYSIYNSATAWKLDINNNTVRNCVIGDGTTTATGTFYGLYTSGTNSTAGSTWTFSGNTIDGISRSQSVRATGTFYGIYNTSSGLTFNVTGNTVSNVVQPGSSSLYGIYISSSAPTALNVQNNFITDLSKTGGINVTPASGNIYGIYVSHTATNGLCTVQENNVLNLTNSWRGQILPYRCDGGATSTMKVFKNRASNISSNDNAMFGIYNGVGLNVEIYGNLVYNMHADLGDSASFYGICSGSTTTNAVISVYNNYLSDLSAPLASVYLSSGLYLFGSTGGTTHRFYNNSVYLNQVSATGSTAAIYANVACNLDMRNNVLVNNSTGGGFVTALWRSGLNTATNMPTSNNNCLYAGTPGPGNLLYWVYDATTPHQAQTIGQYQTYFPQEGQSFSELPPFVNVATKPYNLRMQTGTATGCESGATVVTTPAITVDYDDQARYPNAGYPVHPSHAATNPDVGADEFGGIPSYSCTTPAPGYTLASVNNICLGTSVTFTVQTPSVGTGLSYQWESSADGSTFSPIPGATLVAYTVVPTAPLYYRCTISCLNGPSTGTSIPVQVQFLNSVTSTTPGSRCGTGTVSLAATGAPGTTLKWYAAAQGGTALYTGSPFTTPSISTTTNYYAAAETNSITAGTVTIGTDATSTTTSSYTPFTTLYRDGRHQFLILASELTSAGLYAGNITSLALNLSSVGSPAMTSFAIALGLSTVTTLNSTAYETGLTDVYTSASYTPAGTGWQTINFTTPFNWDGTSNLVVQICFGDNASYSTNSGIYYSTTATNMHHYGYMDAGTGCATASMTNNGVNVYRANMRFGGQTNVVCSSDRKPVTATINTPPTLSVTAGATLCTGTAYQLNVTSNIPDYDTYVWSPATDLYTDAGCTAAYDGTSSATTVWFKSSVGVSRTYTCTASQLAGNLCSTTATAAMLVIPVPTISSNPASICVSGSATVSATPTTGYGTATFQWQTSADNVTFSDIAGATTLSYVTPVLTSTTYYKLIVKKDAATTCSETVYTMAVNNPSILSVTDGSRCGIGSVTLHATATAGATINWYSGAAGGASIGTGSSWATPSISATTTYYASATQGASAFTAGLPNNSATYGTWGSPGGTGYGLYFTATQAMTIVSAYVYPQTAGTCTYQLQDGAGVLIPGQQLTVTYTSSDVNVRTLVNLNFVIPGAGSYRLMNSAGTSYLGRFNPYSGPAYPLSYGGGSFIITQGSLGTGTYYSFFDIYVSSGCESSRTPVVATVTTPPAITATISTDHTCAGYPVTLDVTSPNTNYTYLWMPGSLSGATQVVHPETSSTYTVTANDAGTGCSTTGSVSVTVNATPSPITITPSAPVIAPGTIQDLVATGGTITGVTVFSENFNAATNSWTTVNSSTSGTVANAAWTLEPDGYLYSSTAYHSNDNTQFYMTNSDAQGSGGVTNTELISPVINTSGFTALTLKFWHYFNYLDTDSKAYVEVSTDGGTTWGTNILPAYTADQGSASAFVQESVDMTAYINQTNLKIRFHYQDTYGWYWCVDNVLITGSAVASMTWSPVTELYSDNLATVPYAGESLTTVWTKPTANHTYTATSTNNVTTCSRTKDVTVTVASPMSLGGTATNVTCNGGLNGAISTTVTGGIAPLTYLWSNAATTANLSGIAAGTYTVTVTDATLATVSSSWTVTEPAAIVATGVVTNASCPNSADGLINLTVSGGTPGFTFAWSNGSTMEDLAELNPGTYTVTVTDATPCTKVVSFTVNYTDPVCNYTSVTGTISGTVCHDAHITITASNLTVTAPSGNLTLIAAQNIHVTPLTAVQNGAYAHFYISNTFCNVVPPMPAVQATGTGDAETDGRPSLQVGTFNLFPNPTNGNFTLVQKTDRLYGNVKVEVYGMNGNRILTESMTGEKKHEFGFSSIPAGLYFVKIIADDTVETIKLVKTR